MSYSVTEYAALLAMDSSMPGSARVVLFFLIGLLLVILGFLVAFALLIRKRPPAQPATRARVKRVVADVEPDDLAEPLAAGPVLAAPVGSAEGLAVEAGTHSSVSCPTCRREYDGDLVFCPSDARRLVPSREMLDRQRGGGSVCPRCRRAFDPGVRFCPHDASELVPVSIYEATSGGRRDAPPAGVLARICPQCRKRYDLAATFCGKDGSELKTIN